jgi:hypothetical protein
MVARLHFDPGNGEIAMITILVILLVLALLGGGFGHGRFGAAGWSPAAIIVVILVVLALSGRL